MSSRPYVIIAVPTMAVVLVLAAILLVVGAPWWLALLLGLAAGAALAWWLHTDADRALLSAWGAVPLVGNQMVDNLIDGLVVTHGFVTPDVAKVECSGRNSAMVASQAGAHTLVLTTGLLENIDRVQLEAVLARQLGVARETPIAGATLGAKLVSLAPTIGVARMLREYLLGSADSFDSDRNGALLIRYPPGLTAALEAMARGSTEVPAVEAASAHLWLADPAAVGATTATSTHPALSDRITFLREL